MNEKEVAVIPYFAHEGEMSRMERTNKRLWILIIILIVALIGTNAGWIIYESQFTEVVTTTEIEAEQDGDYNFVSGGDLNYGAESKNQDNDKIAGTGQ